jgi:hypothetical protein
MADKEFAIAVKRDKRAEVPRDWVDRVRHTEGVTIVGGERSSRLQIRATSAAIDALGRDLAEFIHIEPLLTHERS